jgi:endonuclease YncB( thermonuclease family)
MPRGRDPGKLGVILALITAIVVTIVIFNGFVPDSGGDIDDEIYIPDYSAGEFVEYVNDGDTFKTVEGDYVRMLGINTEETGMPHSSAAKHRLEQLLAGGEIRLERDVENEDQYGRLLRYVWAGDVFVNLEMVREGHAHVYVIEPNVKHWDDLKEAEEEAIAAKRGLWQPSAFDVVLAELDPVQGSGEDGLHKEHVTFRNNGTATIDLGGWTVKDEGTHIYRFGALSLAPNQTVTLSSGEGPDSLLTVYWQLDSSIWNNDGDVCFLRDSNGLLVAYMRYE